MINTFALRSPKIGCVTCKARRKKCDQRKPGCVACERNVLICVYLDPASDFEPKFQQGTQEKTPASPTKSPVQALHRSSRGNEGRRNISPLSLLSLSRPESSFLHSHFLHSTAHMLSAMPTEHSPFVRILLPIAAQSDMVLQAVLALSGVHFQAQRSTSAVVATYEHFAQALRGLKYGLTKLVAGETELALELALTTLLFCFIECIRGDVDGNAFHHLKAARQLFRSIVHDTALMRAEPETFCFLLEYYVYVLSLSSWILAGNTDFDLAEDIHSVFSVVAGAERPMTGMLLGCANELFALIPYAAAAALHNEPEALQRNQQCAEETWARVVSWSPPQDCSRNWAIAGKLYQLAILLLLQQHCRPDETCSFTNAGDFICLLESLDVGSEITTTLCWPLAVAGFFAFEPQHRQAIDEYLTRMVEKYGFGNLIQLKQMLHQVWQEYHCLEVHPGNIIATLRRKGLMSILLV